VDDEKIKRKSPYGSRFIRFLIKIGSSTPLPPAERRKRIPAVAALLVSLFAVTSFSPYHILKGHYHIALGDFIGIVVFSSTLLYIRSRQEAGAAYFFVCFSYFVFFVITTVLGRREVSYFLWAFVFPPMAFSILGEKKGMIASMLFFFVSLFLMVAPEGMVLYSPYSRFVIFRYTVIYLILTFIVYYYEVSQQQLLRHIENEKRRYEIESKHDPLTITRLLNRRGALEQFEKELDRQLRLGRPFTFILGDIDDFKKLNDTYGHDAGDYVLKTVAQIMQNQVRGIDCPVRWGGEEFLIMLIETELEGGKSVAERIRKKIESTDFVYKGTKLTVTMTFGMSQWAGPDDDIDTCIMRADKALYRGKESGKNKVVVS